MDVEFSERFNAFTVLSQAGAHPVQRNIAL